MSLLCYQQITSTCLRNIVSSSLTVKESGTANKQGKFLNLNIRWTSGCGRVDVLAFCTQQFTKHKDTQITSLMHTRKGLDISG